MARAVTFVVSVALALGCTCPSSAETVQRQQDFSRDPGWQGVHNRLRPRVVPHKRQDFGFQTSHHAGRQPGKIGGTVWRSIRPAYYAKVIEPLTFEDRLSACGKFLLTSANHIQGWQTGSTVFIGWFNAREQGWRPINFLGFSMAGTNEPHGAATIEVSYGTGEYEADGVRLDISPIAPDGKPHSWSIDYDPQANSGHGAVVLTVDGKPTTLLMDPNHRQHGATFNRFGIFNLQLPGSSMTVFIDDLTINGEREDFSADPKWDAQGNHDELADPLDYGINDFGFSATSFAGGEPGELGGRIWLVQEPEYFAHYGDDVGHLTLNDRLTASGRIAFRRYSVDSVLCIGWYNAKNQRLPITNFVGVYLDSYSRIGRFMTPYYGTSRAGSARAGGIDLEFIPDGRVYDWTITYDPDANGGRGAITVTLGEKATTLDLLPGQKAEGAVLNRFGLFNGQGNNGKDAIIYLDDLSYTAGR